MLKVVNSKQHNIIWLLAFVQLLMCFALLLLANSTWYGEFFNRRMREMLVDSYSNSSRKDPRLLIQALKHSQRSGRALPEDIQLWEELSLSSPAGSKLAKSAFEKVRLAASGKGVPVEVKIIALEKEIRIYLLRAHQAVSGNNIGLAQIEVDNAFSALKTLSLINTNSNLVDLKKCISISKQLAIKCKDQAKIDSWNQLSINLSDPEFAKKWYANNHLGGFANDFPPDYVASYYYTRSLQELPSNNDLERALKTCRDENLPRSTRDFILLKASQVALTDRHFEGLTLDTWIKVASTTAPVNDQETLILPLLVAIAAKQQSAEKSTIVEKYILNCLDSAKLNLSTYGFMLVDFMDQCSMLHLYPIKFSLCPTLLELCSSASKISLKYNIDDSSIQIVRAYALAQARRSTEAENVFYELLKRRSADRLFADQIRFNMVNVAIVELANALQADFGLQRRNVFLGRLLRHNPCSVNLRGALLILKADCERSLTVNGVGGIQPSTLQSMSHLCKSEQLSPSIKCDLFDALLRSYTWNHQFEEAQRLYGELKKRYSKDSKQLALLCLSQLNWFRAFPSYEPWLKQRAIEGLYPDQVFQEAALLIPATFGSKSAESTQCNLWLAEYEFCRGRNDLAHKHCKVILDNFDAKNCDDYMPAKILDAELSGKLKILAQRRTECTRRTKDELDCLWSMFSTAGHPKAMEWTKKFEQFIVEKSN